MTTEREIRQIATLWRCAKRRARRSHRSRPVAEERVTERGNRVNVVLLRSFLKRTLEDDAVADGVNDLLFEHIVAGRYHPSVVAESLPSYIAELVEAATQADWQAVANEVIAEAREVNGEV